MSIRPSATLDFLAGHNLDETLYSINSALGDVGYWNRERREQMRTDKGKTEPQHSVGKERCILCGRLAEAAKDQPLSEREYYIQGAGQLCKACYQELYVPRHNENVVQLSSQYMSDNWIS